MQLLSEFKFLSFFSCRIWFPLVPIIVFVEQVMKRKWKSERERERKRKLYHHFLIWKSTIEHFLLKKGKKCEGGYNGLLMIFFCLMISEAEHDLYDANKSKEWERKGSIYKDIYNSKTIFNDCGGVWFFQCIHNDSTKLISHQE